MDASRWEAAFEAVGVWPVAVELPKKPIRFLIWYHRPDGEDRVLMINRRVLLLSRLADVGNIPHLPSATDDAQQVLEHLSSIVSTATPLEEAIPRCLVRQCIEWLSGASELTTKEQANELLNTFDLLRDWHATLEEAKLVGTWPEELDDAANIVSNVVIFHELELADARTELASGRLDLVLSEEVAKLVRWSQ